jgi:hypothetical protein
MTNGYPRISAADLAAAVNPISGSESKQLEDARHHRYVDRWRKLNPGVWTGWSTANGVVLGIWGWKFYRGECTGCGDLMTMCKPFPRIRDWNTGRWPERCDDCRDRTAREEPLRARQRMRRLREKQYAERDAGYVARGLTPPRQGVAGELKRWPIKPKPLLRRQIPLVCPRCWEQVVFATIRPR